MAADIGALLVRSKLIRDEDLLIAREARADQGGTVGEHLVLRGLVDDEELTRFFHTHLMVPRVEAQRLASLSPQVVARIPADLALEFRVVPISLDREENLTLAMSDPSDSRAVDEAAFFTGCYVMRAVATQRQIAWCLARYYSCVTALGHVLLAPGPGSPADRAGATPWSPAALGTQAGNNGTRQTEAQPVAGGSAASALSAAHGGGAPAVPGWPALAAQDEAVPVEIGEEGALQPAVAADTPSDDQGEPSGPTVPRRPADLVICKNPPELHPRSGELDVPADSVVPEAAGSTPLPAVVVDDSGSEPILLEAAARKDTAEDESDAGDLLVLDRPKRAHRTTHLGLGSFGSSAHPQPVDDEASAPPADRRPTTERRVVSPRPSGVDDEWGPPGTTIPPPFLGAVHGFETSDNSDRTPLPTGPADDRGPGPHDPASQRLAIHRDLKRAASPVGVAHRAQGKNRLRARTRPTPAARLRRASPGSQPLEGSSQSLVDAVRALDKSESRDAVIDYLLSYLAESYRRVAFLVLRGGALHAFRQRSADDRESRPAAAEPSLPLEGASTFGDVVRSQLPFSGPLVDPTSLAFVTAHLGEPSRDVLALPMAVRDRTVGVLLAADPTCSVFPEHVAAVARAAALALERILQRKKTHSPS